MKQNIIERISDESGCDKATVRRIATLALRELHRVAATDEQVTTAAIIESYWNFGIEACYHLGGLLMYHDDRSNQPGRVTESLVPETMRRLLGPDEDLPQIKERWVSQLSKRRPESE